MTQKMLLSICLTLSVPYCFAAPEITSITIDNSDGKNFIEIHGTGFGVGPNVVLFDTFSKDKEGDQVSLSSPEIGSWSNFGIYGGKPIITAINNQNNGFLIHDFSNGGEIKIAQLETIFSKDQTEIFMNFDVFIPEGATFPGSSTVNSMPSVSSWKFSWLVDGTGISNDGIYDLVVPSHTGRGSFAVGGNEFLFDWISSSWFSYKEINRISFWQKANKASPATENGEYYFRGMSKDEGVFVDNRNDKPIFAPGLVSNSFDRVRFPGWTGNGDQSKSNVIYDNIYVAVGENSLARIELGMVSDYNGNGMPKIFPPDVWQDNYIKVSLIPEDELVGSYIFVTNAQGETTQTGKTICGKCPVKVDLFIE
ncbi:hypothetical protein [Alkalimarinus sediminis]|uniref:IPT/TIG domain-containing protein n=1 Tax=Alkalimarinus sediminis TaxID=1632866 RepID=A0A9E8HP42_9ALTE|nr:hypothetical protein [Alkalimarinus sediminis]UZW76158.1 hypothetical protein NNL22_06155 [Alkalimarinus sediminis]